MQQVANDRAFQHAFAVITAADAHTGLVQFESYPASLPFAAEALAERRRCLTAFGDELRELEERAVTFDEDAARKR